MLKLKNVKLQFNIYILFILLFVALIFTFNYFNILFNFTSSMPYGFYTKFENQNFSHGDYVSFCLNKKQTVLGLKYKYLEPGKVCDGSMPLIKQIIALPYESVHLTEKYISVSGKLINAHTSFFDSKNRKLEIFPRGTYKQNCYWVLGDYDIANSWDSRYWGCINRKQIISKIKPLLTW